MPGTILAPLLRFGTDQLPTLLDVEADRGVVRVIHATVCREKEAPRMVTKRPRQRRRISVRVPVRFFPEQPDGLSSQVHLAHCVFAVLIRELWHGAESALTETAEMRKVKRARLSFGEFSAMIMLALLDWHPYTLKFQLRYWPAPTR